ncbi:DUF3324 domain-containing protein [Enterococcus casseliflavus]|nr:DUF3324 domain-containing protein [Enterococcus casseliflavus]
MKKKRADSYYLIVLIIGILYIWFIPLSAFAESNNYFSVEALDKDGDVNQHGFYQLAGHPGEQKNIEIRIYNDSDEEIVINAIVNPASTNQNGVPSYSGESEYDVSLVHRMDEIVFLEKSRFIIPKKSSVVMEAALNFPSEEWFGDILGGIRFTKENKDLPQRTVVHEVAYTVGILLNRVNDRSIENNLNLNTIKVGQRNYRNYIEANIQNSVASIINDLSIKAQIFEDGKKSPVYEYDASNMRMAPNSNFDFAIPTGDIPIQSGEYILKMFIKADEKEYLFEQTFSINASDAQRLNTSAVNINQKSYQPIYGMALVGVFILIGITLDHIQKLRKKSIDDKNPKIERGE